MGLHGDVALSNFRFRCFLFFLLFFFLFFFCSLRNYTLQIIYISLDMYSKNINFVPPVTPNNMCAFTATYFRVLLLFSVVYEAGLLYVYQNFVVSVIFICVLSYRFPAYFWVKYCFQSDTISLLFLDIKNFICIRNLFLLRFKMGWNLFSTMISKSQYFLILTQKHFLFCTGLLILRKKFCTIFPLFND